MNERLPIDLASDGNDTRKTKSTADARQLNATSFPAIAVAAEAHTKGSELIIYEAHSLLHLMRNVGVNSERAIVFIQAIAGDYGMDINKYYGLQRFTTRLWTSSSQRSLSPSPSPSTSSRFNHVAKMQDSFFHSPSHLPDVSKVRDFADVEASDLRSFSAESSDGATSSFGRFDGNSLCKSSSLESNDSPIVGIRWALDTTEGLRVVSHPDQIQEQSRLLSGPKHSNVMSVPKENEIESGEGCTSHVGKGLNKTELQDVNTAQSSEAEMRFLDAKSASTHLLVGTNDSLTSSSMSTVRVHSSPSLHHHYQGQLYRLLLSSMLS